MRRFLVVAFIALASIAAPTMVRAESNNLRTFEEGISRVAPNTALAATLHIDKINVTAPVYMGISMNVFAKGVGQWPGTPRPGQRGNIVLGGHRTSASKPFANIDKLVKGDIISLKTGGKAFRYVVTKTFIVKPTAIWITDPSRDATLTLFACHPKGRITHRYVVRASLL
jgi:sortase A